MTTATVPTVHPLTLLAIEEAREWIKTSGLVEQLNGRVGWEGLDQAAEADPRRLQGRLLTYRRHGDVCGVCGHHIDMVVSVQGGNRTSSTWMWGLTIDHVIPRANGGGNEPDNLQAAHFMCNSWKSARTPEQLAGLDVPTPPDHLLRHRVTRADLLLDEPDDIAADLLLRT